MGVPSAPSPSRRNRRSSGWLWMPAAPIFTSVLLNPSRSAWPTWQTLCARSNSRWRSERFSLFACGGEAGTRDHLHQSTTRRHLPTGRAVGVDARARPTCRGSPTSPPLEDNSPAPRLDLSVLSIYVDNFATVGTNAAYVREVGNAVLNGAYALGLKTHKLSPDSGNFELSGLSFSDTGRCRRKWKLWQALRELLRIGHASSRDIVVGALCVAVHGWLLSVCRAVYVFAGREFSYRRRPVRRELE